MIFSHILSKITKLDTFDETQVTKYYIFSKKIIYILMVLTILTGLVFYLTEYMKIFYWVIFMFVILLLRLYSIYLYKTKPQLFTLKQWYFLYIFSAFLTVSAFSSISIIFMLHVNVVYQLIIVIILVGLSSGAVTLFSSDYRLAISYLSILILPLMSIVFIMEHDIRYTLLFILLLYYITHIILIIKSYQHEVEFDALASEKVLLHHLFKEAPLGIFIYNTEMIIIDCNEHFLNIFDNNRETIIGIAYVVLHNKYYTHQRQDKNR